MTTQIATAFTAALTWIIARDAEFRAARKLKAASPDRLKDMGMTRAQANAAFYSHAGGSRPSGPARAVLTGGI